MNKIILDIDEITDSRQVMEARPNRFITLFVYIVIALITFFLLWSYFGEMDVVIKANGIVRPSASAKIISNKAGKIENINISEGKKVAKGDVLFTIDHKDLDSSKISYLKKIDEVNAQISNLKKLEKSINDNTNYFDGSNEDEKVYYDKFLKYQSDSNKLNGDSSLTELQFQAQIGTLEAQMETVQNALDNLNILKSSIDKKANQFSADNSYYSRFLDYCKNVQIYENKIETANDEYSNAKNDKSSTEAEIELLRKNIDDLTLEADEYKSKFNQSIISDIEQNQDKQKELKKTIESNKKVLANSLNINVKSLENYKLSTIVDIDSNISSYEEKLKELNTNIDSINLSISECATKTPVDGIIRMDKELNEGDIVANGMDVATVISSNESKYKVDLMINNADIARLKEGQSIKYKFSGLGELSGKITSIPIDSTVNAQGINFYLSEGDLVNKQIRDNNGEEVSLKTGMVCEAQIITKKEKILYYILQRFNLMN